MTGLSLSFGSVLFFFWKWFNGKLGDGFWIMGWHDLGWPELGWAGWSLAKVRLEMGFGSCEECALALSLSLSLSLSLQVWFPEIV